ncbi:MAG: S53 family peptidase, partial [Gammaproteobacteria bacterium]|nr:S53 family peptidase [Gammaproteobacteria bacterium]
MKKLLTTRRKLHLVVTPIALAVLTMPVYAKDYSGLRNIFAHPPHIVNKKETLLAQAKNLPRGLSPAQVQHAYGFDLLQNQGAGQTIAIVDAFDDPTAEADLGVFSTTFNLPDCTTANGCFKQIYADGTVPPVNVGWGTEISLDVQWAHAIAPQANILLVEATSNSLANLFKAIDVAVQNGATTLSMSWGGGESSAETNYDSTFNVPGVTFTASSGDGGHGNIYPSSSPYVISVGGTSLHFDANGNYLNESAWKGSGGGISIYEAEPDYQTNFPLPLNPNNKRGAPDISMVADPATGVAVYFTARNGWMVIGGTSASSPMVAAMIAIAKSSATTSLTGVNATLYNLAKTNYSDLYNDITTGSNGTCGDL